MDDQLYLFDSAPQREPWRDEAEEEIQAVSVVFSEGIEKPLDYAIPPAWLGKVQKGMRLEVPLGKSNRPTEVFCVDVHTVSASRMKLKFASKILDEKPLVSPTMLELTHWIGEYWLCPWGTVLQSVLPAGVRGQAGTRLAVLLSISSKGKQALEQCRRKLSEARQPLSYANHETLEDARKKAAREHSVISEGLRITPVQEKLLTTLELWGKPLAAEELIRRAKVSYGPLKLLRERGFIQSQQARVRTGAGDYSSPSEACQPDLKLNTEQEAAMVRIREALHERGTPRPILLHGVTGSGKTEVYVHAIRETVRTGRQAIVLVPEISLTPQTVQRFKSRFGNIAVLHSRLTDAQRHDEWQRILHGDVEVIIGARSAVFAPTPRLGLIVIDEEHETSFKQDSMAPRYHAREVAIQRGRMENALVILGSATPSLETWHQASIGNYVRIPLTRRVKDRRLPEVATVDLRIRDQFSNGAIGRKLHMAMEQCLREKHQMILFLNRRGFSTHIQCPACGAVLSCPHCEISLTHHRTTGEVICHYCDYHASAPTNCPQCGSPQIRYSGMGTQKLEVEIQTRFPKARVLRMDADSMQARGAHEKAFAQFRAGEADVLLGTQMIAKGLDFPNVTLVGVVNADTALHLPDFRAEERTFHLITQVAGRTGRGDSGGTVLVQSFQPENAAIQFACGHDYLGFANYALPLRKVLKYPPYGELARIVVRGTDEGKTRAAAESIARRIQQDIRSVNARDGRVLGPAPCPVVKLRDFYRFHIQVHAAERSALTEALNRTRSELKIDSDIQWIIDLDPLAML